MAKHQEGTKPEVSLILVNKDYQDLTKELFPSLRKQTFKDFELIVVDYGSENPNEIISLAQNTNLPNIQTHKIKSNLQEARNYGVQQANGKYICVLELDAVYKPRFLEIMLYELKEAPKDVAYTYCNFQFVRDRTKHIQQVPEFNVTDIKGWQTPILVKREYIIDYRIDVEKLQDWWFAVELMAKKQGKGKKISTDEPLWVHLQPYPRTMSWQLRSRHTEWANKLKEEYPEFTK